MLLYNSSKMVLTPFSLLKMPQTPHPSTSATTRINSDSDFSFSFLPKFTIWSEQKATKTSGATLKGANKATLAYITPHSQPWRGTKRVALRNYKSAPKYYTTFLQSKAN